MAVGSATYHRMQCQRRDCGLWHAIDFIEELRGGVCGERSTRGFCFSWRLFVNRGDIVCLGFLVFREEFNREGFFSFGNPRDYSLAWLRAIKIPIEDAPPGGSQDWIS